MRQCQCTQTDDGLIHTITDYSDVAGLDPVAETVDSYDADGRMIEQIQISSGDGGGGRAYLITTSTYNDANELTSETDNGVTQSYSYDAAGELLGDALVTYAYDPNGNRAELVRMSSSSGSGSGNNEVVNDGTWTYTYDIRGDLIGKNDGAGDIWTYTYDVGNRLVGAQESLADGGSAEISYTYDVFDNLIGRTSSVATVTIVDDTPTTATVSSNELYAFDNWKTNLDAQGISPSFVGQENADVWADFKAVSGSGSGSAFSRDGTAYGLESQQVFGSAVNSISAQISPVVEGPTGVNFIQQDYQGSVRAVLNNDGHLTNLLSYNGFGISTQTNPAPNLSYGYTGSLFDPVLNAQDDSARWFYVTTGTFMTPDPWGEAGSGTNLTLYVKNEFTDATDPSGKELVVDAAGVEGWKKELATWNVHAVSTQLPNGSYYLYIPENERQNIGAFFRHYWKGDDGYNRIVLNAATSTGEGGPWGNLFGSGNQNESTGIGFQNQFPQDSADLLAVSRFATEQRGTTSGATLPEKLTAGTVAGAGYQGLKEGSVLVADGITGGNIDSLHAKADQLIADNGGSYAASRACGTVAGEALKAAVQVKAIGTAIQGVERLSCGVATGVKVAGAAYGAVETVRSAPDIVEHGANAVQALYNEDYERFTLETGRTLISTAFVAQGIRDLGGIASVYQQRGAQVRATCSHRASLGRRRFRHQTERN